MSIWMVYLLLACDAGGKADGDTAGGGDSDSGGSGDSDSVESGIDTSETGETGETADTGESGDTGDTGDTGAETGDTADTGSVDPAAECPEVAGWITTHTAWTGDGACFDGSNWGLGRVADPAVAGTLQSISGRVMDFQSGEAVGEAVVDARYGDDASGAVDATATATAGGAATLELPMCQPLTVETSTPPDWGTTVDTYAPHSVVWPGASPDWASMGASTTRLLPALLGVSWTAGTGIVAGVVQDCVGRGIADAQVILRDAGCAAAADAKMFYFQDSFPSSSLTATSDDGLYISLNVPAGAWVVEAWGWDGSAPTLLARSPITVVPDSVELVGLPLGIVDGVWIPNECL